MLARPARYPDEFIQRGARLALRWEIAVLETPSRAATRLKSSPDAFAQPYTSRLPTDGSTRLAPPPPWLQNQNAGLASPPCRQR